MKTRTINVYSFDELNDKAKEKAIDKLYDINVNFDWWESTYDDANEVGVKITGFDVDRGSYCEMIINDCEETAKLIMSNHGKMCNTYKTAENFILSLANIINTTPVVFMEGTEDEYEDYSEREDLIKDLENEFEQELSEDYLKILRDEYEYQTSKEAIIETIEANEYEFDVDGNLL